MTTGNKLAMLASERAADLMMEASSLFAMGYAERGRRLISRVIEQANQIDIILRDHDPAQLPLLRDPP